MRSRLLFLLAPLPLAFVAANFAACSSPPQLDDLCGWLGDPNNCYRTLALDVGDRCGTKDPGSRKADGEFPIEQDRTALESCVLFDVATGTLNGSVTFDPPLDVTNLPIKSVSFVMKDNQGVQCGTGSVGANGAFSISIDPTPVVAEGEACPDSDTQICGGSFTFSTSDTKAFSVTCPSSASFNFSTQQLDTCNGDDRTNTGIEELTLDQLMPRAEFTVNPGGIGQAGSVVFRVHYPVDPPAADANGKPNMTGTKMTVVKYFDCKIPAAASTCTNGVQDNGEKGIDCGLACNKGCNDGTICQFPQDCSSNYCAPAGAVLKCQPNPNGGAGGGGGSGGAGGAGGGP